MSRDIPGHLLPNGLTLGDPPAAVLRTYTTRHAGYGRCFSRGNQHQTTRTSPDLSNSTGGTSNCVPTENLAKKTWKMVVSKLGTCFSTSFTHQNHQDARGKHFRSGTCNPNTPVAWKEHHANTFHPWRSWAKLHIGLPPISNKSADKHRHTNSFCESEWESTPINAPNHHEWWKKY